MNPETPERIALYYREGSSDKVYQASIEPSGRGFVVNFAFGRRGNTLQTGTKTPAPVDYATAKKVYDKLILEKTAKGYTPGADGTPYQHTGNQERVTGVLPQLLNPIDESDLARFIADDDWLAQEKFDGKRLLLRKTGRTAVAINRNGLTVGMPESLLAAVLRLHTENCLLDGEAVGEVYYVFDLLERERIDLRSAAYSERYLASKDLVNAVNADCLRCAEAAIGSRQKQNLLDRLKKERKEGIVFKRLAAPYTPGRPNSDGAQLKFKFTATASCIVVGASGAKRSVALELVDGITHVPIGSVTIPGKQPIPARGQIVEVRYLYAYPGGSLYQPVYLGKRDDVTAKDCRLDQLKCKSANEDDTES